MNLDPRTAYFFLFLTNFLMGLSILVAVGRHLRRGEAMWTASLFVQGLGLLIIMLRGAIATEVSIVFGSAMFGASLSLAYLAVCGIFSRRPSRTAAILPVAIEIACSLVYLDDSRSRFLWQGLIFGTQELLVLWVLTRAEVIAAGARPLKLLISGYVAGALAFFGRAYSAGTALMPVYTGAQMPANTAETLATLLGFAGIIVTGFGMLLLHRQFMERETERLAALDSLTGIFNRRILMDLAARALALSRRTARPLALAMLDLDHFKSVNDRYGHQIGDEVLIHVAKEIRSQMRQQDIAGRYGGEEFCVVLPDTDAAGAATVAERIRTAIEQHPTAIAGDTIRLTASIGVSVADGQSDLSLEELVSRADRAMYRAKEGGRNRVAVHGAAAGAEGVSPARTAPLATSRP